MSMLDDIKNALSTSEAMTTAYIEKIDKENQELKNLNAWLFDKYLKEINGVRGFEIHSKETLMYDYKKEQDQ